MIRDRRVLGVHAPGCGIEQMESFGRDSRDDFRRHATPWERFTYAEQPARASDGSEHGLRIQRLHRSQIDHFDFVTFGAELLRDREGFVKAFLGGNGTPADCMVPPEQWGSVLPQPQVKAEYAKLPSYPFSIENAKKELAQSSHPNGFTTNKILVPSSQPAVLKALESLSTTVKQIGITMPISQVPSNDWLANIYAHKDLGIVCLLFLPDYADPADYMNLVYPSANAVKNNFNLANYKNPKVDKLIQDANSASSNDERANFQVEKRPERR